MPTPVTVSHDRGEYAVHVGPGATGDGVLAATVAGRRVFVVSSEPILALHRSTLERALAPARSVDWLVVPDGEAAKCVAVSESLWRGVLAAGGKRDSLVLAFGGGSVGDLAGFVAASFLRGVDFVQVPTSLLAQVDASVGGKVAIDLPEGKNTVGAFHQPLVVIADTQYLSTLSRRQLVSGLVESIKMAVILDLELLDLIEETLDQLLLAQPLALEAVIARSVLVKARIVAHDPFERDQRRLLNFGHTLAHALEVCLDYRQIEHGEAVAHGMLFALRLSRQRGLDPAQAERVESLIERLAVPALPELPVQRLVDAWGHDKKARETGLAWVLMDRLGSGVVVEDLDPAKVRSELERFLA